MPETLTKLAEPNLHKIGVPSYDYSTFILFRKSTQIVRKYNAIGVSISILQDLLKRKCQLIIIKIDGVAMYKISPDDWLKKGIVDQLVPNQEPHAFMPIAKLRRFL